MKRLAGFTLGIMAAISAAVPATAKAPTDCPLRDAPFSIDSPLIDVLLSPAAKRVLDRETNARLSTPPAGMSAGFMGTTPPSFAAILTVRASAALTGIEPEVLDRIDADLRKLRVTSADKAARCARYDAVPPKLAIPASGPRVLLFEKVNGFRDAPSLDAARAAFLAVAREKGWQVVVTDKGSAFTPAILGQFDAVVWNNVSGDVLTLSQRAAFQGYMENGGGFVGVHGSGGDPVYFWDWYADTLLGARFKGHTMNPQFQDAWVNIGDPTHPIARGLPASWLINDEWYSFQGSPRATGARIVATLNENSYKPEGMGGSLRMGDHPIAWTRCVGRGRMFYSAIGHLPGIYSEALYRRMLSQGLAWAIGIGGKDCAGG